MKFSTKSALALGAIGLPVGIAAGALLGRPPTAVAPAHRSAVAASATAVSSSPAPIENKAKTPLVIEAKADDGVQILPPNTDAPLPPATPPPTSKPTPKKAPSLAPAPAQNLAAGAPVVCIDPGHPSETSDGANSHGLSENRLNWQVALDLKPLLEARGIRCVLTKSSEHQRVTNRERADTANNANAALFVRLHCDEGAGRGFRWYYPDREGKKYGVSGPPVAVQRASRRAASILNDSMKNSEYLSGFLKANPVTTDASTFVGGKQGGVLTGSIFARVPTALIEMCFINQKNDAQFIASEGGRQRMAQSLAQAIELDLSQTPSGSWKKL